MYSEEIADKVEDYLNGVLTEGEANALESQIQQDPSFAAFVTEMKESNDLIHFSGLAELRSKVGSEVKDIPYSSGKGSSWLIYGSVILILGAISTIYLWPNKKQQQSSTIYSKGAKQEQPFSSNLPATQAENQSKNIGTSSPGQKEASKPKAQAIVHEESTLPKDTSSSKNTSYLTPVDTDEPQNKLQKEASQAPATVVVPCDKLFTITTSPTCKDKTDGAITIYSDMSEDYIYHLEKEQNINGEFNSLGAGEYNIKINYAKCSHIEKAVVEEKWCAVNEDFSFNPNYGEKWVIKYQTEDKGTFSIFSGNGKLVYKGNFGSEKGYWDGTNQQGELAPMGNYIAMIEYEDGRKEKVQLTIIN